MGFMQTIFGQRWRLYTQGVGVTNEKTGHDPCLGIPFSITAMPDVQMYTYGVYANNFRPAMAVIHPGGWGYK